MPEDGSSAGGAGGVALIDGDPLSGGTGGTTVPETPAACGALACIDFETGTFGNEWGPSNQDVKIVKGMAAHGEYAVWLPTRAGGRGSAVGPRKLNDHKGPLFGRHYMYLSRPHTWSTSYMMRTGRNPTVEFGGLNGAWQLTPAGQRRTFGTVPSGRWVCVQWEIQVDPIKLTLIVDGKTVGEVAVPGQKLTAHFLLQIGMQQYHPETVDADVDLWIDDIVIDNKPVACLPD